MTTEVKVTPNFPRPGKDVPRNQQVHATEFEGKLYVSSELYQALTMPGSTSPSTCEHAGCCELLPKNAKPSAHGVYRCDTHAENIMAGCMCVAFPDETCSKAKTERESFLSLMTELLGGMETYVATNAMRVAVQKMKNKS